MKKSWLAILAFLFYVHSAAGQSADSVLFRADPVIAELDSILNSADSVSILGMIDSILAKVPPLKSQLAVRLGYNSNVTSTGRTINVNKFGLSPGLSYYHKSGAYADVASYWTREYDPSLYLTVFSAGYLFTASRYWSVMGEFSHYYYSPLKKKDSLANTPYKNNLFVSNFLDLGIFTFRVDYSLLFGEQTAHRISPVAGLNLTKKKWLGLDRVTFFPNASVLYGREVVTKYVLATVRPITFSEVKTNVWGIMNYSLVFPLSLTLKNWNLLASYIYNFPQTLPSEELKLIHGGYATLGITRYFNF